MIFPLYQTNSANGLGFYNSDVSFKLVSDCLKYHGYDDYIQPVMADYYFVKFENSRSKKWFAVLFKLYCNEVG